MTWLGFLESEKMKRFKLIFYLFYLWDFVSNKINIL